MPTIQPFKISSLHAWSHDITIYFMPIKIRHIPLADFVTFPTPAPPRLPEMSCWNPSSSCYFTYGRQIIIYPVKEKLLSIYMTLDEAKGWGTGRTINWTVKSLTKPQSAVKSPVYIAVVINNYTQVYYFNRCCTSVLLITKILGLKNRLYKESEILPWCFFQHMHKPVRAASAACEQI